MQKSLELDTPVELQRKVFMDIMIYFANRGRENVIEMTREDFELNTEENGHRFFPLKDKMTKNHRDDDDDEQSQAGLMYEITGHPRCPVTSLLKYTSNLNPACEWFWQRPRIQAAEEDAVWYVNMSITENQLGEFTKLIAEKCWL